MVVMDSDRADEALAAARRYAEQDLRVAPIKPGTKYPPMRGWQHAATTDPATIDQWWGRQYRGHGVCIATGESSGTWALDVDVAGEKVGAATLAELEASYGPLPATVESVTGTGGRHLLFAWDPDHPVSNDQSGRAGQDLDVRGEGGQIVVAPTRHPDGGTYQWAPGRAPGEHAIAPAPGWLYGVLEREPERPAAPAAVARAALGHGHSDSPAAAFVESTTWPQLLERDGWTLQRALGNGEQRWVRPGKDGRAGISATVGHKGRDCLKVFTSSVPELAAGGAYSRFGYEAAVRYGADTPANRSELARQLRRDMTTEQRVAPAPARRRAPARRASAGHAASA
jgi:hypothetical protein